MKKYILLLTSFIFSFLASEAQNLNLQNGTFNVNCATGGVLFDSGGPGGPFGNNENITMTICPDNPGFGVFATIVSFDIVEPDALCIYDGNNTGAPLLPGNFAGDCFANNTDLEAGGVFQSSVNNASGCLTFQFTSDATVTGNFQFNLSCEARCQSVLSGLNFSDPDTVIEDGSNFINICLGDTLNIEGAALFPENNVEYAQSEASSTFRWEWGDNSPEDIGQNQNHFYNSPGGYIARLTVFDVNGCRNFQDQVIKVRVAPIPQFVPLTDTILCLGESDTLVGLPQGLIVNGQVVQGDTVYFVPPVFSGDSIFLPDGSGVGYNSNVFLSSFDNNSEIINCGDILEVCVNMEHSFLGDLEMTIICPNGQSAILKAYPGGGGTFLGNPWDGAENANGPGEGLRYCFNSAATTLMVNGPTQPATLTTGNTIVPGDYLPVEPFTNLIGCPINGQWTLNITDNLFSDDGYLFNWELNIHPCMYPEVDSFLMLYDFGFWDNDPSIVGIVNDSNTIIIEPIDTGLYTYTYFTQDQFGCEYNNSYQIFVDGFEVEASPSDTTICSNEDIQLDATLQGVPLVCEPEYTISNIPVNMLTGTQTNVTLGDDQLSPAINMPFNFEFYCNSFNRFLISSNGYISFDNTFTGSGCCSGQTLPSPATPNNLIALYWSDLNPGNGGQVSHFVTGTAPNRVYVTQFSSVPHFGSTSRVTGQIQLFEGSNIVEIHCQDCQSDNGIITIGLENATGTIGHPAPGHNATGLAALNRAWRFVPANSLGAYTFNWTPATGLDNPNIQNPVATVSATTTYTVSATNLNGCTYTSEATINVGGNFNYTIPNDTVICVGDTIQLIVTGGGETYTWTPNDGTISDTSISSPFIYPIATTTYTVAIDSAGCIAVEDITVTVSGVEVLNTIVDNESCAGAGDGSIEIIPVGPVSNNQYSIDGGLTFVNTNIFTNLGPGDYDIVVGGGAACDTAYTVSIIGGDPLLIDSLQFSLAITCDNNDGFIEIFVSGGVAPLQFSIDGGNSFQTSSLFENLTGGAYNIVVEDALGCSATDSVFIDSPLPLDLSISGLTNVTCFGGADGAFQVDVTGGVPGYEYSLNEVIFDISNQFAGLSGGDYTIFVRDSDLCLDSISVTITEADSLFITNVQSANITCFGLSNGSISFEAQGGTASYQYSIDGGNTFVANNSFTGLAQGSYSLQIRDANNCLTSLVDVTITEPTQLSVSTDNVTNVSCNGGANGAATTIVVGGTTPYTFSWTNGGGSQQNLANVGAGTYTLTVTDANGCTATTSATITQPTALVLTLSSINISCNGGSNGSITSNISGGVAPYTYLWNTGASNANLSNLTAGNYSLTVTDANNCTITQSVTINEPQPLVINITSTPVLCFGGSTGTASASVTSGGTAPFSYQWDAAANNQTSSTATNLSVGTYVVAVTDANGCIQTGSVSVTEPTAIEIVDLTTINPSCFGGDNGSVSALAIGGVGLLTYTLQLTNGTNETSTNGQFSVGLEAGQYTLTVSDVNGCTASQVFQITNPEELLLFVTGTNPSCFGEDNGSIQVLALNGEEPYTFTLGDGTQAVSNTFVVGSGIYNVTVTDANGCSASQTQIITDPAPVIVEILSDSNFVEMGEPLQLTATTQNTTGQVVYTWTPSEGLSCADCQNPLVIIYDEEEFTVSITDSLGCTDEASLFIEVSQELYYFIPNAFTPGNIDGTNDDFRVYGQNIKFVEMTIFNRWGEKVFESASPFVVWDGTFKGELQQPGVYTYYTKITFLNDRVREAKGSVTLLR